MQPKLDNDACRMILEIKQKNFEALKKCPCGREDFAPRCTIINCYECDLHYCTNTPGYSSWIWVCEICCEYYCGDHPRYCTQAARLIRGYCKHCVKKVRDKESNRIASFSDTQREAYIIKRAAKRRREESPELI